MLDISHPKFLATIDINEVDTSAIKQLVIVENGDMMVHLYKWHQYLPEQWQGSLFLYRGQGKNIKLVNELLERLADTAKIAVYSDFDPSGLLIVLNYISSRDLYIVVPKDWQNLDEEHSSNRLQIYLKQISQSINFDEDSPVLKLFFVSSGEWKEPEQITGKVKLELTELESKSLFKNEIKIDFYEIGRAHV